jgi:hypothetical protein
MMMQISDKYVYGMAFSKNVYVTVIITELSLSPTVIWLLFFLPAPAAEAAVQASEAWRCHHGTRLGGLFGLRDQRVTSSGGLDAPNVNLENRGRRLN